jgi:hypothetical protein
MITAAGGGGAFVDSLILNMLLPPFVTDNNY